MKALDLQGVEYTNDQPFQLEQEISDNTAKYIANNLEKLKDITLTDDEATKLSYYDVPRNDYNIAQKIAYGAGKAEGDLATVGEGLVQSFVTKAANVSRLLLPESKLTQTLDRTLENIAYYNLAEKEFKSKYEAFRKVDDSDIVDWTYNIANMANYLVAGAGGASLAGVAGAEAAVGVLAGVQTATQSTQELSNIYGEKTGGDYSEYLESGESSLDSAISDTLGVISGFVNSKLGAERLIGGLFTRSATKILPSVVKSFVKTGTAEVIEENVELGAQEIGYSLRGVEYTLDDILRNHAKATYMAFLLGGGVGAGITKIQRGRMIRELQDAGIEPGVAEQITDQYIDNGVSEIVDEMNAKAELQNKRGEAYNTLKDSIKKELTNVGYKKADVDALSEDIAMQQSGVVARLADISNMTVKDYMQTAMAVDNVLHLRPYTQDELQTRLSDIREELTRQKNLAEAQNVELVNKLKRHERILKRVLQDQFDISNTIKKQEYARKAKIEQQIIESVAPDIVGDLNGITQAVIGDKFVYVGNNKVPVEYKVVDLGSVKQSHINGTPNPDYKLKALQNRASRATQTDLAVLQDRAKNLRPEELTTSPNTLYGAPVVNENGEVIAGNGRTETIRLAYEYNQDGINAYHQLLKDMGFNIDGMKNPILVRSVSGLTEAQQVAIAEASNVTGISELDHASRAKEDSKLLAGTETMYDFANKIPQNQRQGLWLNNGTWDTQALRTRYNDAIMSWLLGGDTNAFQDLYLSGKLPKKVTDSLANVGSELITFNENNSDVNIREDIRRALQKLATTNRNNFLSKVQQTSIEAIDLMPENSFLYYFVFGDQSEISTFARSYMKVVEEQKSLSQENLFGEKQELPEKKDLYNQAFVRTDQEMLATPSYKSKFDKDGATIDKNLLAVQMSYQNQFAPETGETRLFQEQFDLANENARLDEIYPEYTGETINIDGKERTVYNSNGERIAKSEQALRNFYKWFGDSKVVDEQGRPLVVYHGSKINNLEILDSSLGDSETYGSSTGGTYFTSNYSVAMTYMKDANAKEIKEIPENNIVLLEYGSNLYEIDSKTGNFTGRIFKQDGWYSRQYKLSDETGTPDLSWYKKPSSLVILNKNLKSIAGMHDYKFNGEDYIKQAKQLISDLDSKETGKIYPVYLKMKKPLVLDFGGESFSGDDYDGMENIIRAIKKKRLKGFDYNFDYELPIQALERYAKEHNYDSLIVKNVYDNASAKSLPSVENIGDDFVVFEQNQIKSVDNRGTYDSRTPNIYYQAAYAGSRVDYDQPSLEAIGSGQTTAAHGWGLYYTLSPDIADMYRKLATNDYSGDKKLGQVHEVDIPEMDVLLDEQKPLNQQNIKVIKALRKIATVISKNEKERQKPLVEGIKQKLGEEAATKWMQENTPTLLEKQDIAKKWDENNSTGREIYDDISRSFNTDITSAFNKESDKKASQLLDKYGIKGISYYSETDGNAFVIFNPESVKVLRKKFDELGNVLFQGRKVNGYYDPELPAIVLGAKANNFTLSHEFAHHWLTQVFNKYKTQENLPEQFRQMCDELFAMIGVDPEQTSLTTEQHEKWATMNEAYIGGFVLPELQDSILYKDFQKWSADTYKSIMQIGYLGADGIVHNPILTSKDIEFFNKWYENSEFAPELASMIEQKFTNINNTASPVNVRNDREKAIKDEFTAQQKADTELYESMTKDIAPAMQPEIDKAKQNIHDSYLKFGVKNARERMTAIAQEYVQNNPEHAKEIAFANPLFVENDTGIDRESLVNAVIEHFGYKMGTPEYNQLQHNIARQRQQAGSALGLHSDSSYQYYLDAIRQINDTLEEKQAIKLFGKRRNAIEKYNLALENFINKYADTVLGATDQKQAVENMLQQAIKEFGDDSSVLTQIDLTELKSVAQNKQLFVAWAKSMIKKSLNAETELTSEQQIKLLDASNKAQVSQALLDSPDAPTSIAAAQTIRDWQTTVNEIKGTTEGVWAKVINTAFGEVAPRFMLFSPSTLLANVPGNIINYSIMKPLVAATYGKRKVSQNLINNEIKRVKKITNATGMNFATMIKPSSPSTLRGERYKQTTKSVLQYADPFMYLTRTDNLTRIPTYVDVLARLATQNAKGDTKKANELFLQYTKLNQETGSEADLARREAITVANIATFTQDGTLARTAMKIRDAINTLIGTGKVGFGNILSPFVKTPANIIEMGARAIASPFTAWKGLFSKGADSMTRLQSTLDLTTLGLAVLGTVLISALQDDDEFYHEEYKSGKYDYNTPYDSLRFGNTWIKIDQFGTLQLPIRFTAAFIKEWKKSGVGQALLNASYTTLTYGMKNTPIIDQFTGEGSQLEWAIKKPGQYTLNWLYNRANTFVPAWVKQISRPVAREAGAELYIPENQWYSSVAKRFSKNYGLDGKDNTINDWIGIIYGRLKITE